MQIVIPITKKNVTGWVFAILIVLLVLTYSEYILGFIVAMIMSLANWG